jgi:hypothetical protein
MILVIADLLPLMQGVLITLRLFAGSLTSFAQPIRPSAGKQRISAAVRSATLLIPLFFKCSYGFLNNRD